MRDLRWHSRCTGSRAHGPVRDRLCGACPHRGLLRPERPRLLDRVQLGEGMRRRPGVQQRRLLYRAELSRALRTRGAVRRARGLHPGRVALPGKGEKMAPTSSPQGAVAGRSEGGHCRAHHDDHPVRDRYRWSRQEERFLARSMGYRSPREIGRRLGRTPKAVGRHAEKVVQMC